MKNFLLLTIWSFAVAFGMFITEGIILFVNSILGFNVVDMRFSANLLLGLHFILVIFFYIGTVSGIIYLHEDFNEKKLKEFTKKNTKN
jgi:hypothetical protein